MGFKLNISKGHCLMVLILMYCPKYLVTSFLKLFRTIIISGKHAKGHGGVGKADIFWNTRSSISLFRQKKG